MKGVVAGIVLALTGQGYAGRIELMLRRSARG
jgi:hypothetical protein